MHWIAWLGIAVVVAAIAAVTGFKPRGTRPVAHTRMMAMGRLALLAIVVIFAFSRIEHTSAADDVPPTAAVALGVERTIPAQRRIDTGAGLTMEPMTASADRMWTRSATPPRDELTEILHVARLGGGNVLPEGLWSA